MPFIYKDEFEQKRYLTAATLKKKLITLEGSEHDTEQTIRKTSEWFNNFLEFYGIDKPEVLVYSDLVDIIKKNIYKKEDLNYFLPMFSMERVHFLSVVYLMHSNLVSIDSIKKIINAPFYSRTDYLIKYLSGETTESIKNDTLFKKFYEIFESFDLQYGVDYYKYLANYPDDDKRIITSQYSGNIRDSKIQENNYTVSQIRSLHNRYYHPQNGDSRHLFFNSGKHFNIYLQNIVPPMVHSINFNKVTPSEKMNSLNNIYTFINNEKLLTSVRSYLDRDNLYGSLNLNNEIRFVDYLKTVHTRDLTSTPNIENYRGGNNNFEPSIAEPSLSWINNEKVKTVISAVFPNLTTIKSGIAKELTLDDHEYMSVYWDRKYDFYDMDISMSSFQNIFMSIDFKNPKIKNGQNYYKLNNINKKYLSEFKKILSENIPVIDLFSEELTELEVTNYFDELLSPAMIDLLKELSNEKDIVTSIMIDYFIEMYINYINYTKELILSPDNMVNTFEDITYISEGLAYDYKLIEFIQLNFNTVWKAKEVLEKSVISNLLYDLVVAPIASVKEAINFSTTSNVVVAEAKVDRRVV